MPYSDWDDYLIHQSFSTLDHVEDSDPHWTDRFYFNCHARDGSALLVTGFAVLPNQQRARGYAKLSLADGRHWDFKGHRPCVDDRWEMVAEALRWEVVTPRKEWRLRLLPNESGVEYDITFHARAPIWELQPIIGRKGARIIVRQHHIQQSGTYTGWYRIGDETVPVDGFYGSRDRTWGIRNQYAIDFWIWFSAQFEDRAIAAWIWETSDGEIMYVDGGYSFTDGRLSSRFIGMEHDTRFEDGLKRPTGATITFTDQMYQRHTLTATPEHPQVNNYYGEPLKPRTGSWEWQFWDSTDEALLRKVEGQSISSDSLMRYELDGMVGYGIYELYSAGDGCQRYPNWSNPQAWT